MAWQTQDAKWRNDGVSLASAQAISADGVVGSAVAVGRGDFDIVLTVSGYVGGSTFDSILLVAQANTLAATSTWTEIGNIVIGDADGRGVALTSLSNIRWPVANEGDNQVRIYAYFNGSAQNATVSATAVPRISPHA